MERWPRHFGPVEAFNMQSPDTKIGSKPLYQAFELIHRKKLPEAEALLTQGLKEAEAARDLTLIGLYYSAFGVLYKIKKDYRKAWKYYEKAEKNIPDDPALKIISARLLVDYFGQYDTVIRKMEKVLSQVKESFPLVHEVYNIQGLAYLKKGNKKQALECLKASRGDDFKGLQTAANFDFRLLQELVRKKIDLNYCHEYLKAAQNYVQGTREVPYQKMISRLLENFPT